MKKSPETRCEFRALSLMRCCIGVPSMEQRKSEIEHRLRHRRPAGEETSPLRSRTTFVPQSKIQNRKSKIGRPRPYGTTIIPSIVNRKSEIVNQISSIENPKSAIENRRGIAIIPSIVNRKSKIVNQISSIENQKSKIENPLTLSPADTPAPRGDIRA